MGFVSRSSFHISSCPSDCSAQSRCWLIQEWCCTQSELQVVVLEPWVVCETRVPLRLVGLSVVLTPLTLVNKGQVNLGSVFRTGQSMVSMRVNVTGSLQLHGVETTRYSAWISWNYIIYYMATCVCFLIPLVTIYPRQSHHICDADPLRTRNQLADKSDFGDPHNKPTHRFQRCHTNEPCAASPAAI